MESAATADTGRERWTVQSEGGATSVPALPRIGLRSPSLESDGRAETEVDFGSDRRTQEPLLGRSARESSGVHDRLPEGIGSQWMSFGGVQAAQILADYWLWEALLNVAQGTVSGIVELGTGKGGFSLFLAAQAQQRDLFFRTYDIAEPACRVPGFVRLDIYARAEEIGEHLARHDPVILFCDGGNKPREVRTFSTYLSPASMIVVHDWGTEMLETDVPYFLEEDFGSLCDSVGSMSRVLRVRS